MRASDGFSEGVPMARKISFENRKEIPQKFVVVLDALEQLGKIDSKSSRILHGVLHGVSLLTRIVFRHAFNLTTVGSASRLSLRTRSSHSHRCAQLLFSYLLRPAVSSVFIAPVRRPT